MQENSLREGLGPLAAAAAGPWCNTGPRTMRVCTTSGPALHPLHRKYALNPLDGMDAVGQLAEIRDRDLERVHGAVVASGAAVCLRNIHALATECRADIGQQAWAIDRHDPHCHRA